MRRSQLRASAITRMVDRPSWCGKINVHMQGVPAGAALAFKNTADNFATDKNIQHTVRYTDMSPDRFKDFWRG